MFTGMDEPSGIFISLLKHKLKEEYSENWEKSLRKETGKNDKNGNKLRTYNKFKFHYTREPYLEQIENRKYRSAIAKLRTSSHKLNIEAGRYKNIKLENRLCTCCTQNKIEDEIHFLIQCPAYTIERTILYDRAKSVCSGFMNLTDENKFIWLLTTEQELLYTLGVFIHDGFKKREALIFNHWAFLLVVNNSTHWGEYTF